MLIVWHPAARDDLRELRRYIAERNPAAASSVVLKIRTSVRRLSAMPYIGRPGRLERTRELVVSGTPYVVAYAIVRNAIVILAVLHGAQKWPESFDLC